MRIHRTLSPTAAPIPFSDLLHGLASVFLGWRSLTNLEAEVKRYFNIRHAFFVSSGKAALTLILIALKSLSSRRKVLIPAYTCFSVPSAVAKAGLDVSLCDLDPTTLDFDFTCLTKSLDEHTLCVVPTHLLGLPSDVDRVKAFCKGKGIFVIEDAAQAMGTRSGNRLIGTTGDVGFFSLGRGKNLSCGSGGIIVTNSDLIAQAIQSEYVKLKTDSHLGVMRNLFEVLMTLLLTHPKLYWLPAQLPFLGLGETRFYLDFPMCRMDKVRAGLLEGWQGRLEHSNEARFMTAMHMIARLAPGQPLNVARSGDKTIFLRLPVVMEDKNMKENICTLSREKGLGISPLYPTAIQAIKELQDRLENQDCPVAAMVADCMVTLPVHCFVQEEDLKLICTMLDSVNGPSSKSVLLPGIRALDKESASA